MKMKNVKIMVTSILFSIFIVTSYSFAEGIKDRMKERKPVITALLAAGTIGENRLGILEFMGEELEKQDVVEAENKDRKKVYAAIGKQQGVPAESVGKRRALKIAAKAKQGTWLQNEDDTWYQKK